MTQSVMSASDMLGHWDVRGLSAAGPRLRLRISVHTMPKDFGMQAVIANVGNFPPHISVHVGIAQQCTVARLGAMLLS